jgi:hypothetical protein
MKTLNSRKFCGMVLAHNKNRQKIRVSLWGHTDYCHNNNGLCEKEIKMSCLIVSDQIRVQMNAHDVAVPASDVVRSGTYMGENSALQRPDMSRMRLAAMLRRTGTTHADTPRLSWSVMLNSRISNCANSTG